jgi:alkylation response protein AidB-like acyl-CoA dehydrogenase
LVLVDRDTLDLFARTVRGVLAGDGGDRTAELEASGWRDVLLLDSGAAVPVVFRTQGELRARTAALDDVAIEAAGPDPATRFDVLGDAVWVHAPGGAVVARANDSQLVVDGLALRPLDRACSFLADGAGGVRVATVAADALEQRRIAGMDPSLGLVRVRGSVPVSAVAFGADASRGAVEAACRRALAFELTGLVSTMLATTSEYAGLRTQFGQPIGAFQAVKHRLADVLVALRSAEVAASESFDVDAVDAEVAAMAAKCLAGRAARLASENCLQVMGAIGFTEEHDLHRFIARATVLDVLFGSARQLRIDLGRALLRRGSMPRPGQP